MLSVSGGGGRSRKLSSVPEGPYLAIREFHGRSSVRRSGNIITNSDRFHHHSTPEMGWPLIKDGSSQNVHFSFLGSRSMRMLYLLPRSVKTPVAKHRDSFPVSELSNVTVRGWHLPSWQAKPELVASSGRCSLVLWLQKAPKLSRTLKSTWFAIAKA